jgi:multidrug transporter EmrE-like cation transporter
MLQKLLAQRAGCIISRRVHQYLGARCFGCRSIRRRLFVLVVSPLELAYAYPFIALSFDWVEIDSTLLFGEPLLGVRSIGIALIIAGVIVSALAR